MTSDFYVQIMGCVLITAFTVLVVCCVIWFSVFVYDDIIEKRALRRWKKKNRGSYE
jgi:hypothetical protein